MTQKPFLLLLLGLFLLVFSPLPAVASGGKRNICKRIEHRLANTDCSIRLIVNGKARKSRRCKRLLQGYRKFQCQAYKPDDGEVDRCIDTPEPVACNDDRRPICVLRAVDIHCVTSPCSPVYICTTVRDCPSVDRPSIPIADVPCEDYFGEAYDKMPPFDNGVLCGCPRRE